MRSRERKERWRGQAKSSCARIESIKYQAVREFKRRICGEKFKGFWGVTLAKCGLCHTLKATVFFLREYSFTYMSALRVSACADPVEFECVDFGFKFR